VFFVLVPVYSDYCYCFVVQVVVTIEGDDPVHLSLLSMLRLAVMQVYGRSAGSLTLQDLVAVRFFRVFPGLALALRLCGVGAMRHSQLAKGTIQHISMISLWTKNDPHGR
jgi:hypothetical protein